MHVDGTYTDIHRNIKCFYKHDSQLHERINTTHRLDSVQGVNIPEVLTRVSKFSL